MLSLLFFVLPLILLVNWSYVLERWLVPSSGVVPTMVVPDGSVALSEFQQAFLLKELEKAAAEIASRIDHENTLYKLRFTIAGAVLALLSATGRSMLSNLTGINLGADRGHEEEAAGQLLLPWVAVCLSALVDSHMIFNTNLISQLGGWVATLEQKLGLGGAQIALPSGWESYVHQKGIFNQPSWPVAIFSLYGFTLALYWAVLGLTIFRNTVHKREIFFVNLAGALASCAIFAFTGFQIWPKDSSVGGWSFILLSVMFAGLAVVCVRGVRLPANMAKGSKPAEKE